MPSRWGRTLLVVALAALLLYLAGFALFGLDGTEPGAGDGDTLTGLSQP